MNKKILILTSIIIIMILGSIGFFYFKKEIKIKNSEKKIEENIDPNIFKNFDACSEQDEIIISGVIENIGSEIIYIKTSDNKDVETIIHLKTLFIEQVVDGEDVVESNEIKLSGFNKGDSVAIVSAPQENGIFIAMVIKKLIFK